MRIVQRLPDGFLGSPGGFGLRLAQLVSLREMIGVDDEAAHDDGQYDPEEKAAVPVSELLDMADEAVKPRAFRELAARLHVPLVCLPVFRVVLAWHLLAEDHLP